MDFSFVLPPGVGINDGMKDVAKAPRLELFTNTNPPVALQPSGVQLWYGSTVAVLGRAVYCVLTGGIEGTDYRLAWTIWDTQGNRWTRTALMLCASTS